MATNLPLGSYVQDGLRSGPLYSGAVPASLIPFNPTEPLSYSAYGAYGPGLLYSPQCTWNMTPNATEGAGFTILNNLVALTAAVDVTGADDLQLRGDNLVTRHVGGLSPYVQFDWPRIVTVTIGGTADAGDRRVTIFGTDWYGNPLQHTYVVNARQTYPVITLGNDAALSSPAKAFYTVDRVYIDGALAANSTISLGAADVFGLPYVANDLGNITSIGWGGASDLQDNSAFLSSPVSGIATLVGGTAVVRCSAVTASSIIQATRNTPAGTIGNLSVPTATIVSGTGFTINSDNALETSTVDWTVINPLGQYSASGVSVAMVAGVVTISTSQVQANSVIQLSLNTFGTAHGQWRVSAIVPGVSFTVTSSAVTETSTVSWAIMPDNWESGTSANLTAGSVFVSARSVTENSKILLTHHTLGGVTGVLSAPTATIIPGVGFTITSSSGGDTSTVNWTITELSPNLTQGTATLVAGTVVVLTTAVAANSVILLTDNTLNLPTAYVSVSARTAGASFTITAAVDTDVSSINWVILPNQFYLPTFTSPLGAFVKADQRTPAATTGDVRGLYAPSTASTGKNTLRFTYYVQGADVWQNQVSNSQFIAAANNQPVVGVTVNSLTPADLYGLPQFYTGNPS